MAKQQDDTDQKTGEQLLEARVDAYMDADAADDSSTTEPPASAPLLPGRPKPPAKSASITAPETPAAAAPAQTEPTTISGPGIGPATIDTPESDAAIDDIVAQEADTVLAAQDAGIALAQDEAEPIEEPRRRGHPIFWFLIVLLVILAVISAAVLTNPNLLP